MIDGLVPPAGGAGRATLTLTLTLALTRTRTPTLTLTLVLALVLALSPLAQPLLDRVCLGTHTPRQLVGAVGACSG